MAEIVIIGAGLTGLSAAYHLEQLGFYDFKIFEKNDRAGGLLQSVQHQGFTFDYTGHLLHISDPAFLTFVQSTVGINHFNNVERKTGIFSHNVITDYPFQINLNGLPLDVATACIEGYINRSTHLRKPKDFYHWVLKHFGAGMGKHFFFPYNHKLLAYDLKKVHPSWTGRFVPSTSLKSILKGTLEKKPPAGIGYNSSFYYPKHGGIEFLIHQIMHHIKNPIITNHCVEHIDTNRKIIFFNNGHQEQYHHLITTMPLNYLVKKLSNSSHHTLQKAEPKLLCNSVVNINLGFNVEDISSMHWLYFPEKKFPFYRLGFWNNISASSVPLNHSAIYGEFSYLPTLTSQRQRQQLEITARKKILDFLGLSSQHVVCEKILHLAHAYVIYDAWREKNLPKLLTRLKAMSIHSIGRYGGWKYSSMQEAFLDGKDIAKNINNIIQRRLIPAHQTRPPAYIKTKKHLEHITQ